MLINSVLLFSSRTVNLLKKFAKWFYYRKLFCIFIFLNNISFCNIYRRKIYKVLQAAKFVKKKHLCFAKKLEKNRFLLRVKIFPLQKLSLLAKIAKQH